MENGKTAWKQSGKGVNSCTNIPIRDSSNMKHEISEVKQKRFGDWIPSPYLGGTYSCVPNR
jgi:hypothetical protein